MIRRKQTAIMGCLLITGLLWLCSCGGPASDSASGTAAETGASQPSEVESTRNGEETGQAAIDLDHPSGHMETEYAENFSVDYYDGGYKLLSTMDGTRILTVPEGEEEPDGLPEDVIVLTQPVDNIYLVSSSVMDTFRELGALDTIRFSAQKEENWYVPEAREAMERGDIVYAGKYSSPDYEQIVSGKCSLAIENSMILHCPEVKEMLENFGIPVMIEYSSYESHPLGRVEWIKYFGALTDREEEAEQAFQKQTEILNQVTAKGKTDKTAAFFYVTSNGLIQVRQSSDYIPKMIELAGGRYIFDNLGDPDSKRSSISMQVEEFYSGAKDADFLIYNSTIDGELKSVQELLEKCPVLSDFKAVKEGNVWCTTNDMYQQSMSIGYMIEDMSHMFRGDSDETMRYLYQLK